MVDYFASLKDTIRQRLALLSQRQLVRRDPYGGPLKQRILALSYLDRSRKVQQGKTSMAQKAPNGSKMAKWSFSTPPMTP